MDIFRKSHYRTLLLVLVACGMGFFVAIPLTGASTGATVILDPVNDQNLWTLMDTFSVAAVPSLDISPSGQEIAYEVQRPVMDMNTSDYRSTIYVAQTDGSTEARQLTKAGISCSNPVWSPDGKRIAYLSKENGIPQVWIVNADGTGAFRLTDQETGVSGFRWGPDGSQISYLAMLPPTDEQKRKVAAKEDYIVIGENLQRTGLYLVSGISDAQNLQTARLLTPSNVSVRRWDWSPDGTWITFTHAPAAEEMYSFNTSISRVDIATGVITKLVPEGNHVSVGTVLISPDGQTVAYSLEKNFNLMDISVVSASGGNIRSLIRNLDQGLALTHEITGWSADGKQLYVVESNRTQMSMNAIPVNGSPQKELFWYGNIGTVRLNGWRNTFAYTAEDTEDPLEVYVTPVNMFEPVQVTRLNSNLPLQKIGKTEVIQWNSTDGMVIEGLLTYPVNYTRGQKYPLIVEAHGGPSASFYQYFTGGTSWPIIPAGTFSSLGYAVLRPNIRGSSGYGADFTRANYANWGGGDYQDMMAGVDYLIAQGIADRDKLGIVGQSYGGYMTAWTVSHTNRFRAAVVIDGVTDLVSIDDTADLPYDNADNLGAEYWDNWDLYTNRSPIRYVGNIVTPTLVVSGQEDVRVPLSQAQELYGALWKRGVPSQFIIYPRAGHFPHEPKQIQDLWLREIDWMNRYMPAFP